MNTKYKTINMIFVSILAVTLTGLTTLSISTSFKEQQIFAFDIDIPGLNCVSITGCNSDSYNTVDNSDNSDNSVNTSNSNNTTDNSDNSDNSTNDSYNDNSDNSENTSINDSFNGNNSGNSGLPASGPSTLSFLN